MWTPVVRRGWDWNVCSLWGSGGGTTSGGRAKAGIRGGVQDLSGREDFSGWDSDLREAPTTSGMAGSDPSADEA